tara:strand:+ start:13977 stop:14975 length:999 start_codon:yes stop_codon:yes gene_type:complete
MTSNRSVILWLFSGCFLIFVMVVVGGITRLTNSGLSMVDWNLFMGAIPPLNEAEWEKTFDLYKKTPEYQKINFNYTLDNFKFIFFWEYLHRMIGRLLGLVFIIPFIYFLIKQKLNKKLILQSSILFVLGSLQAFFGWWMVKSGLVDRPDVSHYRLAVHLTTAFLTCAFTLWVALPLVIPNIKKGNKKIFSILSILFFLTIIQIVYGAFMAGLKAGVLYSTWPKMGPDWFPEAIFLNESAQVHFIHRTLAIVIVFLSFYLWKKALSQKLLVIQKKMLNILMLIVISQTVLGILTLIYSVPFSLALSHQLLAFFMLMTTVFCLFIFRSRKQIDQ